MQEIVCWLLQLYVFVLLVRIVLSWFPLEPGGAMATVNGYLRVVTDPVLDPVRRLLPRVGMLDLSPLVVLIVIQVLQAIVCS
jgi:YggT family protein